MMVSIGCVSGGELSSWSLPNHPGKQELSCTFPRELRASEKFRTSFVEKSNWMDK